MKKDCPLCQRADLGFQTDLWNVYTPKRDSAATAQWVQKELQQPVTERQVSRHFAQHEPYQPDPSGNLRFAPALKAANRLSRRQKVVLIMLGQHTVLSEDQLIRILYLPLYKNNLNVARAAAYRDFQKLIYHDFVRRVYPPVNEGIRFVSGQKRMRPGILLAGREAIPYLQETSNIKVSRVVPQWPELRTALMTAQLYTHLAEKVRDHGDRLSPAQWWSNADATLWYRNPLRPKLEEFAAHGFSVLQSHGLDLPFFYVWDNAYKSPEKFVEMLYIYAVLGVHPKPLGRFPALQGHLPTLMIVSTDAKRVKDIRQAYIQRATDFAGLGIPPVIITDMNSYFQSSPTTDDIFQRLLPVEKTGPLHSLSFALHAVSGKWKPTGGWEIDRSVGRRLK